MTNIAPIIPSESVLLLLDYQVGIVGMIPDSYALGAGAATATTTLRAAGRRIGYVRVAFTADDVRALPLRSARWSRARATKALGEDRNRSSFPAFGTGTGWRRSSLFHPRDRTSPVILKSDAV